MADITESPTKCPLPQILCLLNACQLKKYQTYITHNVHVSYYSEMLNMQPFLSTGTVIWGNPSPGIIIVT